MSLFDQELISRLNAVISATIGIYYGPDRLPDLEKAIVLAAQDLGYGDASSFALKLFQNSISSAEVQAIARYLTVAETYFFREPKAFDELEAVLLPLIETRRSAGKKLRLLSAGCCTGEEAYSLAMLLTRLISDIESWQIEIIGCDINQDYLARAKLGVYGPWAFRGLMSEPNLYKSRHFLEVENGNLEITEQLKKMVRFVYLNLADDTHEYLLQLGNQPFDLILCRNVLIYFDKLMIKPVLQRLTRLLREGGWLLLSATEVPSAGEKEISENLHARLSNDVYLFQRVTASGSTNLNVVPSLQNELEYGRKLLQQGDYSGSARILRRGLEQINSNSQKLERRKFDGMQKQFLELLVRALSNMGSFDEAARQADLLVKLEDKYDYLYLYAVVLSESGRSAEAITLLKKATLRKPDFAAASFMLASIYLHQGDNLTAHQYLNRVRDDLAKLPPESLVECTDGTSVKELRNIVEQLVSGAQ